MLQPSEYDISYFDGAKTKSPHGAGYSSYERWHRVRGVNSLGEYWKDLASQYKGKFNLAGKKVLEIGCAKGFVVEDLRGMGVDARGIDVSSYAISQASDAVKPFLVVGDVRTALSQFGNKQFDVVFSLRVLECIPEADLPSLVSELNRVSKFQFHVVDEQPNPNYYLVKPLSFWRSLNWNKGTVLISNESNQETLK
jgi:2-polyprenyl-3-methyl-5-hydroxy-6-metoxy-1,4-benzoquinol methylase